MFDIHFYYLPRRCSLCLTAGLLFFISLFSSPASAQDSSFVKLDLSGFHYYDSLHGIDNIADLPINMKADDYRLYSFDSLLVGKRVHNTHSRSSSTSCTEGYNISLAANAVWYVSRMYEAIITANMAWSAEEGAIFVKNLKSNHRIWCDCISTNYGYTSHLCDDQ
jgi:hypothetical protein